MMSSDTNRQEILTKIKEAKSFDDGEILNEANVSYDYSSFGVQEFKDNLKKAASEYIEIDDLSELPSSLKSYLNENNLSNSIVIVEDGLKNLDWQQENIIVKESWSEEEKIGVTFSQGAIAETGQIFINKSIDKNLSLFAETHIVLVKITDISPSLSNLDEMIQANIVENKIPTSITLICGPSRTADIEQKLILGAHGPKKLMVVLY